MYDNKASEEREELLNLGSLIFVPSVPLLKPELHKLVDNAGLDRESNQTH